MTSKFISFFQLVEACGNDGCPVCRCVREDSLRYMRSLMYEQVTDPTTRGDLRDSWGFCNWHAWMLTELPDEALGTAIISEDLLEIALTRLHRLLVRVGRGKLKRRWLSRLIRRRPRIPLLDSWRRKTVCPVCRSGRFNEESYLQTILEFVGDPEFDKAFSRSWGVCLPHLLQLIELGRHHPRLEPVLKKTEAQWRQLQEYLKGFIEKHDYRATEKFTEEEARSWRQAIEMLSGAPGLFGNELHPTRPFAVSPDRPPAADHPPAPAGAEEIEALRFEKAKLELRLKQLTDQYSEVSSRASALHYRLWQVMEDRKVVEMNLSAERASSEIWKRRVEELKEEVKRLQELLEGSEAPGRPA